MGVEIERKYIGVSRDELRPRLVALGAVPAKGAHFESNVLYDDAAGSLEAGRRLLRLRVREWPGRRDCRLTYKEPLPDAMVEGRPVKRRREIELGVDDPAAMGQLLEGLGYRPCGRYEKVRESWILDGAHVEMDELVFGDVVEIEGTAEQIADLEHRLALDNLPVSANSYHELYRDWALSRGQEPGDSFAFPDERRAGIRKGLGLDHCTPAGQEG